MMYAVIAIKELNDPVVELAGVFDTQEKAFEARKMVEEWLEDDGFDNYDVFILGAVTNFLDWYDIGKYFEGKGKMTRYHICGIGYDKNDCVTDYETNLGDFDDYEEAYEEFVKLQCEDVKGFFQRVPNIYKILIQLEECEETDEEITCIDVKNEWWITNPNYKEEV